MTIVFQRQTPADERNGVQVTAHASISTSLAQTVTLSYASARSLKFEAPPHTVQLVVKRSAGLFPSAHNGQFHPREEPVLVPSSHSCTVAPCLCTTWDSFFAFGF